MIYNDIGMYSAYNYGWKIYKKLKKKTKSMIIYISISKNMYIDKLADIINKYNNTYHSALKMKPVAVNSSTYIDLDKKNNKEDPRSSNFNLENM